jgi:hypothetical protein
MKAVDSLFGISLITLLLVWANGRCQGRFSNPRRARFCFCA